MYNTPYRVYSGSPLWPISSDADDQTDQVDEPRPDTHIGSDDLIWQQMAEVPNRRHQTYNHPIDLS